MASEKSPNFPKACVTCKAENPVSHVPVAASNPRWEDQLVSLFLVVAFVLLFSTLLDSVGFFGILVAVEYLTVRTLVMRSRKRIFIAPACVDCSEDVRRLDVRHRALEIASGILLVVALTSLKATHPSPDLRIRFIPLFVLGAWIAGCMVWLARNQRPVNASLVRGDLMFEFTNAVYVKEVRAANDGSGPAG